MSRLTPQRQSPDVQLNLLFLGRAGFALPGVILVLTVLLAVAVPTLVTVQQEWQVAEATVEAAEADEAAAELTVDLMAAWDTAFFALPVWGDTAFRQETDLASVDFTVTRTSNQLFLIEALTLAHEGGFVRGSALTVRAGGFDLAPQATLTVVDGAEIIGGADAYGIDAVVPPTWPSSVCTGSTVRDQPAVSAPDAALVTIGQGSIVSGVPSVLGDPGISASVLDQPAGADYKVLAEAALHTFPGFTGTPFDGGCDTANPLNWGNVSYPTGDCGDHFPIIHVSGDAILEPGSRGQGILLVDGNLILSGNVYYYGLVVVRGRLTMTGDDNRIRGAAYAGSAVLDAGGSFTNPMLYNVSCVIDRLRAAHPELGEGVRPVSSRSWVDLSGTQ